MDTNFHRQTHIFMLYSECYVLFISLCFCFQSPLEAQYMAERQQALAPTIANALQCVQRQASW